MYIYTHTNSPFYADKNLTLHTKALPFYYSPPLPIWCFDVKCDLLKHKLRPSHWSVQNPVMPKVTVKGLVMAQSCFPVPTCHSLTSPPTALPVSVSWHTGLLPLPQSSCILAVALFLVVSVASLHMRAGTNPSSSFCLLRHHFLNKADLKPLCWIL